jgi:protein-disulfide isomerase
MSRQNLRRFVLAFAALPLALGLAACSKGDETAVASGEPIAKVAAPAGKAWADVVTKTEAGGFLMGNPQAPIKVIEFGALSCSHCAEFAEKSFAEMRDNFIASGRVSFELRLFMLNALDVPASLLATCSSPEATIPLSEQFWAWQPTMFENLQKSGDASLQAASALPPEQRFGAIAKIGGMDQFFATRGVSAPQGAACLADAAKATELVNQTDQASKEFEISGTPTFLINGAKFDGNSWDVLKARLETMGAR